MPENPAPGSSPTPPLEGVLEGFGQLATWYWGLLVDQAKHTTDQGLVPAVARWSALPVVGMAALAAEVVDAASLIARPAQARRERTSDEFLAPAAWLDHGLSLQEPLRNGFGEDLAGQGVAIAVTSERGRSDDDHTLIRLRATGIPADRVGVYGGRVGPSADDTMPVWLVIP